MSKSEDFHFGNFKGVFEETWAKGKKVECTYCPCSQKYLALGSGLWYLMVVLKDRDGNKAWKMGPVSAFKSKYAIKCCNAITSAFSGKNGKLVWVDCAQSLCVEAESRASAIMPMIFCGMAERHDIQLMDAWDKVGLINSKGGKALASASRDWALNIAHNQKECWNNMESTLTDQAVILANTSKDSGKKAKFKKRARDPRSRKFQKRRKTEAG